MAKQSQRSKPDDKEQSKLFIKKAREIGADEAQSTSDDLIERLARKRLNLANLKNRSKRELGGNGVRQITKLGFIIFFVAIIFANKQATAEVIDFSTITCKQFFEGLNNDETATLKLVWVLSYFRDSQRPYILDTSKLLNDTKKLSVFCGINPDVDIVTAANKALGK